MKKFLNVTSNYKHWEWLTYFIVTLSIVTSFSVINQCKVVAIHNLYGEYTVSRKVTVADKSGSKFKKLLLPGEKYV